MRSIVSLVEARPDTIAEDYRRVLDLASLDHVRDGAGRATLAAQAQVGGWFPGTGSPPWQLAGVLDWLSASNGGPARATVAAVDPGGGACSTGNWGWENVMAAAGATMANDIFWERRPWSPAVHRPALGAALSEGLEVPAGLDGGPLVLLPVPSLSPAWPVAGAVRLLVSLILGRLNRPRRLPVEEILAEAVSQCREVLDGRGGTPLAAVMDGVIWDIGSGHRGRGPVTRNILLAGQDPVAVDTVATMLAGNDPARVPWLRLCGEQGLGAAGPADIRLVGQVELAERPFGHPEAPTQSGGLRLGKVSDLSWRILQRPTILRRHRETPWGRLFEDYRQGANPGDSR
jgi:hypothetical protein